MLDRQLAGGGQGWPDRGLVGCDDTRKDRPSCPPTSQQLYQALGIPLKLCMEAPQGPREVPITVSINSIAELLGLMSMGAIAGVRPAAAGAPVSPGGPAGMRCRAKKKGARPSGRPLAIVAMSFQPAIPQRVARQQSPPPATGWAAL